MKNEFIIKANKVHNNKYDYSKVEYKNNKTTVKIICPEHGEFEQIPSNHLRRQGCKQCSLKNSKHIDFINFINELNFIYKNNEYIKQITFNMFTNNNIKLKCAKHGEFNISKDKLLQGYFCIKCNKLKIFIDKAIKVHGNKYDYSKVEYKNMHGKVKIICPKHGEFEQALYHHLEGRGCKICGINNTKKKIIDLLITANKVHGNKYDYSKVEYINTDTKVIIICPEHGEFEQTLYHHINRHQGCPLCGNIIRGLSKKINTDFINRAIKVHGNKYDYSKVEYKNMHGKVKIVCPEHGEFEQSCGNHLYQKNNCPHCLNHISSQENKICEFLKENNIEFKTNNRILIKPLELDIYLPDYNLAIEVNGLYWHSESNGNKDKKYHLNKTNLCKENNIQLLHFFEDELNDKFEIVKNIILSKTGKLQKLCGARQCEIKEIDSKIANEFLLENHIHGKSIGKIISIGAYFNNKLVAIQSFKQGAISRNNKDIWELDRFCTINGYNISGIASRLFKYFTSKYLEVNKIVTYADLRFSNGNLYNHLGFDFVHQSKPNYFYVIGIKRLHRFSFRKSVLKDKLENFDENLTEYQNMLNHGYDRIWDCGHLKFEWNRK